MNICPLKDYNYIWRDYNSGIHSLKFLNTSVADLVVAFILASLLTKINKIPFIISIICCLVLLLFVQLLLGVKTDSTNFILKTLNILLEIFFGIFIFFQVDKVIAKLFEIKIDFKNIRAHCYFDN